MNDIKVFKATLYKNASLPCVFCVSVKNAWLVILEIYN